MFVRPLALGLTAPAAGEALQWPRMRGCERLLLFAAAMVSVADKILGVGVVWWGQQSTILLELMLIIQGAASGVMTVSERLLVLREVEEVDRANVQGIISMADNISSSTGMALGVALVSAPYVMHAHAVHGLEVAPTVATEESLMHDDRVRGAALERFHKGMLVVLVIYIAFLWIPGWIFTRHRAEVAGQRSSLS